MSGSRFRAVAASLSLAMAGAAALPGPTGHAAAGPKPPPLEWVVLGDSFSAGGIAAASSRPGGPRGSEPYFVDGRLGAGTRKGCDRTDKAWPNQVDKVLGRPGEKRVTLKSNVSCAGALIDHVVAVPQTPKGQNVPGWSRPNHPYFPVDPDGDPATLKFPRLKHPQLAAVKPSTKLVTVGVGWADMGLTQIFTKCMRLGEPTGNKGAPCKKYFTKPPIGVESIQQRLDRTQAAYTDMLERIRAKAHSDAMIMAVGYPFIIPDENDIRRCTWGRVQQMTVKPDVAAMHHFGGITHEDLNWLRDEVIDDLNVIINDAMPNDPHFEFLGLWEPGEAGHDVCADAGPNTHGDWIEGLIDQTPKAIGRRWPRPGFFQGNVKHHEGAAETVVEEFREVLKKTPKLEDA
ncbi:hypothetical protein [Thermomonospora umbrina]|uniref:GDSL-like lipase/acylhydrolase family protein n=1 Tax=Thermomonospora umbrina TaxID=111806 RepID=A0A3D9SU58_9ACTN|nr:hypothetical protein [Thermomonospora umbrina]REE97553.1 hypothetical protein DFJ69_3026 [Thermomonospora umbrina]